MWSVDRRLRRTRRNYDTAFIDTAFIDTAFIDTTHVNTAHFDTTHINTAYFNNTANIRPQIRRDAKSYLPGLPK
jgi:hypothetical protein